MSEHKDSNERAGLEGIQPVVLVGGGSTRFGRDKLLEPVGADGRPLVTIPIDALRAVFGARVALVGECDARVQGFADRVIPDAHPGAGPIGGIVSALRVGESDAFVLAGDLPGIDGATIGRILDAAGAAPHAWAVLGETDCLHPCIGLYRGAALARLAERLASGRARLRDALPRENVVRVRIAALCATNVNAPGDLRRPARKRRQ